MHSLELRSVPDFSIKMLWLTVSNALDRSTKIPVAISFWSIAVEITSHIDRSKQGISSELFQIRIGC